MHKSEIVPISKLRASSSEIARQWLVKFAAICQKDFSPAVANIWDEQLRDIEPDLLARACDRLMKKWDTGFLPVPGNVRTEANGIVATERLERSREEEQKQREDAKRRYERAIAYADHKRQHQLPALKPEPVPLEQIPPKKRGVISPVQPKTIDEQKEILRSKGYL